MTPLPNLVGLLDAAILDRNLGAPPEELLSACMAAGRYMSCVTRWSLPFAPKWLHVEQWDAALLSCMTNDQAALSTWLENYPAAARHFPPGTRTCGRILEHWIRVRQWPENLKLPKSLDQFELGFATAMKGLVARDENLCSQGVVQMLRAFRRIDYRMVRGRWLFDLCLQVIAVQWMARREGLKLNVPDDRPNDIQLVLADDPLTPLMPWCPLPGIELVAQSQDTIAWPSLYLNQAVIHVREPLTEH